jgi:hypothetical protein
MALRFSDRELWDRDWFLSLEGKHQLFCLYLRDHCDHAGIWQPSFKRFEQSSGFRIKPEEYLEAVNCDCVRIIVLENGRWWITGFIADQYKTYQLNESNNAHKGIINSLRINLVPFESMGYIEGTNLFICYYDWRNNNIASAENYLKHIQSTLAQGFSNINIAGSTFRDSDIDKINVAKTAATYMQALMNVNHEINFKYLGNYILSSYSEKQDHWFGPYHIEYFPFPPRTFIIMFTI